MYDYPETLMCLLIVLYLTYIFYLIYKKPYAKLYDLKL